MRKVLSVILFASKLAAAGDIKYPVSAIPEELKLNVNAVVREDQMRFKILEKNRATHYVHYVVTIFNVNGKDYATQDVWYDQLTRIVDLNAVVYDAQGRVIKKLKNKEIYDHASYDGFTLFSDDRIKSIDLAQSTYPYTVEFEYELEYKFLYYIPGSWWGGENVSYQHASYELFLPAFAGTPIQRLLNIEAAPIKSFGTNFRDSCPGRVENIKPVKQEAFGPPRTETGTSYNCCSI